MPAINGKNRTSHVPGAGTRQQQKDIIEFLGTADAPHGDLLGHGPAGCAVKKRAVHVGFEKSRRNGIYADVMTGKLERECSRHLDDAGLRNRIDGVSNHDTFA